MATDSSSDSLVAFAIALALTPVSWVVTGLCGREVWAWFIVPAFGGPPITGVQAVGLAFVVGMFTPTQRPPAGARQYTAVENITWALVVPFARLFALGVAWVFYSLAIA